MKRQFIFASLMALCFSSSAFANDLKESVCYIEKHRSASENGEQIVKVLQDNSYITASKKLTQYLGGHSVGSGFVIKDKDGKLVVVTNRHVVGSAKSVDVSFEINGAVAKYSGCRVTKVMDDIDLAVVSFSSEDVKLPALGVDKARPEDGTEVWTAGFPVLANKPSWQLGKGIVSNNSVRDEYFGNVDSVSVIQHTAEVDPGSSGGPLLVKDKKGNFIVIGVNTWKASFRENTNFSIPVAELDKVSRGGASASSKKKEDVSKLAESFLSDYKEKKELGKYISDDMLFSMDAETFETLFINASADLKTRLRSEEPVSILKEMVGNAIFSQFRKISDVVCQGTEQDQNGFKSTYSLKDKNVDVVWKEGGEGYQIASTSQDLKKSVGSASTSIHYIDWRKAFEGGCGKGGGLSGVLCDITWNYYPVNYLSFGWGFEFGHTFAHEPDTYTVGNGINTVIDTVYSKVNSELFGFKMNIGGNCPFNLGSKRKFLLMPYGWFDLGWNISEDMYFASGTHLGVKFGYTTKKKNAVFLGTEFYRRNRFMSSGVKVDEDGCDIMHSNYFMLKLGYAH